MLIDSFLWKGFGTNRCKSNLKFYVNQLLCYVSIAFIFSNLHKKKKKKTIGKTGYRYSSVRCDASTDPLYEKWYFSFDLTTDRMHQFWRKEFSAFRVWKNHKNERNVIHPSRFIFFPLSLSFFLRILVKLHRSIWNELVNYRAALPYHN